MAVCLTFRSTSLYYLFLKHSRISLRCGSSFICSRRIPTSWNLATSHRQNSPSLAFNLVEVKLVFQKKKDQKFGRSRYSKLHRRPSRDATGCAVSRLKSDARHKPKPAHKDFLHVSPIPSCNRTPSTRPSVRFCSCRRN
jgi:hypothetical protein